MPAMEDARRILIFYIRICMRHVYGARTGALAKVNKEANAQSEVILSFFVLLHFALHYRYV